MAIDEKTWLTAAIAGGIALSVGVSIPISIGTALLAGGTQAFLSWSLSWLFPSNPTSAPPAAPPDRDHFFDDEGSDHHVYHHHIEHNNGPDVIILGNPSSAYVAPERRYPVRGNTMYHRNPNPPLSGSQQPPTAPPTRPDGSQRVGVEFRPAATGPQIGNKRPADEAVLVDRRLVLNEPAPKKQRSTPPTQPSRSLTFSTAAAASSQNDNRRETFLNHPTPSTPTPATNRPSGGATHVSTAFRPAATGPQIGSTRPDNATLTSRQFIPKNK